MIAKSHIHEGSCTHQAHDENRNSRARWINRAEREKTGMIELSMQHDS